MPKHKLFTEVESSPRFNSSLDESKCSGKKKRLTASAMTSKPGPSKITSLVSEGLTSDEMHSSDYELDVVMKTPVTKKGNMVTQSNFIVSPKHSDSPSHSHSDSDSMGVSGFFSTNQKLPYTYEEDAEILRFVLQGQGIFRVTSILLWKHLEGKKKNPKRTYHSLKNRFLRNIKPHLFTTYRHLIPDEDTVEKILLKFPELKNQVGRQGTLTKIKLPKRNAGTKIAKDNVSSTNMQEFSSNLKNAQASQGDVPSPITGYPSVSSFSRKSSFHRKVKINGSSLTILVNLNYEHVPSQRMGIYEKFEKLKSKNKLIPCSLCGRCGGPDAEDAEDAEENVDSGADSDVLISDSVESKNLERSSLRKNVTGRRGRRKNNFVVESRSSQGSCSPSLLNDVNEVVELDECPTENVVEEKKAENAVEEKKTDSSDPVILVKEADSTPNEPSPVTDKETDSIYQNTVAEFRRLIDSDEEELLVKKCLKKNRKSIGFDPNLSMEENHVDSYFVKSDSPGVGSASISSFSVSVGSASVSGALAGSWSKTEVIRPLAQNMMNMMDKKHTI